MIMSALVRELAPGLLEDKLAAERRAHLLEPDRRNIEFMAEAPVASAFSSNAEAAITKSLELDERERRPEDFALEGFYEIEQTSMLIEMHGFKRVALQFPDEMLRDSVPIYLALKSHLNDRGYTGYSLFVLADTSYGSCCVDEVAAQHMNADAVVHYGHACLSPTARLPTIYVYGRRKLDPSRVSNAFAAACQTPKPGRIRIRTDVSYNHDSEPLLEAIRVRFPDTDILSATLPTYKPPHTKTEELLGSSVNGIPPVVKEDILLFVGNDSLAFTNMLMTSNGTEVYRYDPSSDKCIHESYRTNKLLMRRYAAVQRARDADVFGILVGTLGVASYLPLINRLRKMLVDKSKKAYTISVGKLNPAKLANFAEIECFIFVACPENSVIESKEFIRPIITPFELEIALGLVTAWDGRYILEFDKVLDEVDTFAPKGDGADDEEPEFSLITGKYRQVKRYGDKNRDESGKDLTDQALVSRNQEGTVAKVLDSASGDFLKTRTWQGLEQRIGQDEPSLLEQGRSGIAKGYREVDHPT